MLTVFTTATMAQQRDSFHWADYLVLAAVLLVSLTIGIVQASVGGKQKTQSEYLLGNRNLKVVPVAMSMFVSFISAIQILGAPAEVYTRGTEFWWFGPAAALAVSLCALILVPLLHPLKLTSANEYLERRFKSRSAKLMGDLLLVTMTVIYMGITSFLPATALQSGTGLPAWVSIVCTGVVVTLYTTVGGLKGVIWTDVFQSVIMIGGMTAIVIVGSLEVGGITEVWEANKRGGRMEFFEMNPDPTMRHSFWSLLFGGNVGWMSLYGVNQASVQRYCSLPSLKEARLAMLLIVPCALIWQTICVMAGWVIYAYFASATECDPLSAQRIGNPNQLLPFFMMQVLAYPGVPGVFVACLYTAAISSVSSSLNAMGAIVWEDMLKWKLHHLPETKKTLITKFIVFIFGCVGVAMAFATAEMDGTATNVAISFIGSAAAPLLGMFLLGGLFPCANWVGAVSGAILGLIFPLWIAVGAKVVRPYATLLNFATSGCPENTTLITISPGNKEIHGLSKLYTVSYMWYASIGLFTTIVVGLLVSCLSGCTDPHDVDPELLIPVGDRLLCCLKEKTLKVLRYGRPGPRKGKTAQNGNIAEQQVDDKNQNARMVTGYVSPDPENTNPVSVDANGDSIPEIISHTDFTGL